MKKNSKNSQKNKTTLLKRIAIALAILLVFVLAGWFIYEKMKEDSHIRDIRSASRRLEEIFHSIKLQIGADNILREDFRKTCGEMSVKYGKGPIACEVSYDVRLKKSLDNKVSSVVNNSIKLNQKTDFTGRETANYLHPMPIDRFFFNEKNNLTTWCHLDVIKPTLQYFNKDMNEGEDVVGEPPVVLYGSCHSKHTFSNYIPDFTRTN